jgi:polar amino acid transport system substrate-binding protein
MSKVLFLLLALPILLSARFAHAQQETGAGPAGADPAVLTVATYECPPFVLREGTGWSGLGILFWEDMARLMNRQFEYRELPLDDLLHAAETGEIDIGVSCISITEAREERVDFSHALYQTHLAIAVRDEPIWVTIRNFLTDRETLFWLGILMAVAALVGGLFYLLEHRINPKLYTRKTAAGKMLEGFVMGLLFITRGPFNYYEFKTLTGRVLTVLLAVSTTLFVASFTAILASTFTLDRLRTNVTGPSDLAGLRVGIKEATTSGPYLDALGIGYRAFATVPEMLDALDAGRLDAVVADDPVLRFEIRTGAEDGRYANLRVLPYQFARQNYGLVLSEDLDLLEEIDRAALAVQASAVWAERVGRYLGTIQ